MASSNMISGSIIYDDVAVSSITDTTKHAFLYLSILLLLWYIGSSIQSWYRLRKYPGPFSAKFSYIFIAKTQRSGVMNKRYSEVNEKYGTPILIL